MCDERGMAVQRVWFKNTPVGLIGIAEDEVGICKLFFATEEQMRDESSTIKMQTPLLKEAWRQVGEYFAGQRRRFELPLSLHGTPFQKQVWQALQGIPYGKVCCYGEIAEKLGRPKAARAVGMANHNNPVAIIVPCHRVIGKNGTLTGYAGGLDKKQALLELERRYAESC